MLFLLLRILAHMLDKSRFDLPLLSIYGNQVNFLLSTKLALLPMEKVLLSPFVLEDLCFVFHTNHFLEKELVVMEKMRDPPRPMLDVSHPHVLPPGLLFSASLAKKLGSLINDDLVEEVSNFLFISLCDGSFDVLKLLVRAIADHRGSILQNN
jgi:hypothetical protein